MLHFLNDGFCLFVLFRHVHDKQMGSRQGGGIIELKVVARLKVVAVVGLLWIYVPQIDKVIGLKSNPKDLRIELTTHDLI